MFNILLQLKIQLSWCTGQDLMELCTLTSITGMYLSSITLNQTSRSFSTNPIPDVNYKKNRATLLKSIFKPAHEPDLGQETNNPYIIALRHYKSDKALDLFTLNKVLAYHNVSITQEEFDIIKSLVPISLPYPLPTNDPYVVSVLGPVTKNSAKKVPGVYVLTEKIDNRQYVGRSSNISLRLRAYYGAKAKNSSRTIDKVITSLGPSFFSLQVYMIPFTLFEQLHPMTDKYRSDIILAVEQYFILHLKPVMNDMLVVGGALTKFSSESMQLEHSSSAVGSKALYVYNESKTHLLYTDTSRSNFANDIGISTQAIWSNISKNSLFLGKYFFTGDIIEGATSALITTEQIQEAIKVLNQSSAGHKHAVKLTDLRSPDKTVLYFSSKAKALKYTVTKKRPVGKTFMVNLPCTHNGWLVETG